MFSFWLGHHAQQRQTSGIQTLAGQGGCKVMMAVTIAWAMLHFGKKVDTSMCGGLTLMGGLGFAADSWKKAYMGQQLSL